jgi:hypothetical protein
LFSIEPLASTKSRIRGGKYSDDQRIGLKIGLVENLPAVCHWNRLSVIRPLLVVNTKNEKRKTSPYRKF